MANSIRPLVRAELTTNDTAVLYTTPVATTTVVTNILVSNVTGSAATFTIYLNDLEAFKNVTVNANSTLNIDLKQSLLATQTIKAGASANTALNLHITGVEIV